MRVSAYGRGSYPSNSLT